MRPHLAVVKRDSTADAAAGGLGTGHVGGRCTEFHERRGARERISARERGGDSRSHRSRLDHTPGRHEWRWKCLDGGGGGSNTGVRALRVLSKAVCLRPTSAL